MDEHRMLPAAQLVEDLRVYPRHRVDEQHVTALADALLAGAVLPPPVVDAASLRIVDGWHRVRAHRRVAGDQAVIDVIARHYASEADLITDAVRLNASHGRRLARIDQVRAVLLLEDAGLDLQRIALVLSMPEQRVERLRVRVAYVEGNQGRLERVPLKRPVVHLRGQTLTGEQAAVHRELGGTSFLLAARQLRRALDADLISRDDERLVNELRLLAGVLSAWLAAADDAA